MSQRVLFAVLFAFLLVACGASGPSDKSIAALLTAAEAVRKAADQADLLSTRLAVFADSATVFADSIDVYNILVGESLGTFPDAAHEVAWNTTRADSAYKHQVVRRRLREHNASIDDAYAVAYRTAFAAYLAYSEAYNARNARLAPKAYTVARHAADQATATVNHAVAKLAAADSLQAVAQYIARRTSSTADSLQAIAQADSLQAADKAARLRHAHDKVASDQAKVAADQAAARYAQAVQHTVAARRAARRAETQAVASAKLYRHHRSLLRHAYDKDAVRAAFEAAVAAAYETSYEAYTDKYGLNPEKSLLASIRRAFNDTYHSLMEMVSMTSTHNLSRTLDVGNSARAASVEAASAAAYALFNAAYQVDGDAPQAYAAQAYAAAAKEVGRIAARDAAYVTPPISTATGALVTAATAYRAYATTIDSVLNSIE